MAKTLDGLYDVTGGLVSILAAPQHTIEMYRAFQALLERTQKGELTYDGLIETAKGIGPEFETAAKLVKSSPYGVVLVFLLLMFLKGCTTTFDVNEGMAQFGTAIEYLFNRSGSEDETKEKPKGSGPSGNSPKEEYQYVFLPSKQLRRHMDSLKDHVFPRTV